MCFASLLTTLEQNFTIQMHASPIAINFIMIKLSCRPLVVLVRDMDYIQLVINIIHRVVYTAIYN